MVCTPDTARDPKAIVGLAEKALDGTRLPNVVIGVPGTDAAPAAVQELAYRGVSTTVDGVF